MPDEPIDVTPTPKMIEAGALALDILWTRNSDDEWVLPDDATVAIAVWAAMERARLTALSSAA